jgi:hypothetical protein
MRITTGRRSSPKNRSTTWDWLCGAVTELETSHITIKAFLLYQARMAAKAAEC